MLLTWILTVVVLQRKQPPFIPRQPHEGLLSILQTSPYKICNPASRRLHYPRSPSRSHQLSSEGWLGSLCITSPPRIQPVDRRHGLWPQHRLHTIHQTAWLKQSSLLDQKCSREKAFRFCLTFIPPIGTEALPFDRASPAGMPWSVGVWQVQPSHAASARASTPGKPFLKMDTLYGSANDSVLPPLPVPESDLKTGSYCGKEQTWKKSTKPGEAGREQQGTPVCLPSGMPNPGLICNQ